MRKAASGDMPRACFGLRLATLRHQSTAWRFRSSKSTKSRPARKFVSTYANGRSIRPLRSGFPTRCARNLKPRVRAKAAISGAGGEQDTGVVDDADRTDTRHEAGGLEQECLGLEAGEARIVLE